MEEEWRAISDYEGLYEVSNLGRVKSLYDGRHKKFREKILRPCKHGNGYLFIYLWKGGERKMYKVHRLVLMTFAPVDGMENLEVNHIDENKTNNNLSNLEWTTHKENMNHGTRNKRAAEKLRGRTLSEEHKIKISASNRGKTHSEEHKIKLSIPIVQIDLAANKVVNVYKSSHDAERNGGYKHTNIIQCCKNKFHREGNNIYKGYKWQYLSYYISQIDPRIKKVILFDREYYVNN